MPPTASPSGPLHRCRIIQVGAPSFDNFNFISSLRRVRLPYFDASMTIVWSLSILDCLVVSIKVSLSFKKLVVRWSLKFYFKVLTVRDLVRSMSEVCQCDRQWILYIILPNIRTLETSPHGTFTDPSMVEVAAWYSSTLPVATSSHLATHCMLSTTLSDKPVYTDER
jgi:hypothetical protein